MKKEDTAEEKIKAAAQKIFIQKGLAGARMQEIADEAGINKAMLHYYFRSKDKLFREIFESSIKTLMGEVGLIIASERPLLEKIQKLIDTYIDLLLENPSLPIFILSEINQNPDFMEKLINNNIIHGLGTMLQQVEEEVKQGQIYPIKPIQLWINILSMIVFPFAARPMLQRVIENSLDGNFEQLIRERKKEVYEFIVRAIKI